MKPRYFLYISIFPLDGIGITEQGADLLLVSDWAGIS